MKEEGQANVVERASNYLDIGVQTMYKLWRSYIKSGVVPHSLQGQKKKVRMKLVSTEWMRPIQEEMERIRLKEGRAVEVPDILKWLQETHGLTITDRQLHYRLGKMGFVFSKGGKLTLKKEEPRIRKLRQDYLKRRLIIRSCS
jgi:transposase